MKIAQEIRAGNVIMNGKDPMIVLKTEYARGGRGAATVRMKLKALLGNMGTEVVFYDGKAISVELPTSVNREVTWTEPAVKGDTSGKVLKPAKIATGFEVPVPLFVSQGDKIEIDTRTGEYRKRV